MSVLGGTHAVVLAGGGSAGAYEVGILKALCSGATWITGRQPCLDPFWSDLKALCFLTIPVREEVGSIFESEAEVDGAHGEEAH